MDLMENFDLTMIYATLNSKSTGGTALKVKYHDVYVDVKK